MPEAGPVTELLVLFAWSFLAATLLPAPSEIPLAYVVRSHGMLAMPILVATFGNFLGACTTYAIGRWGGARFGSGHNNEVAADRIRRYGAPLLLLSWVPVVGDAFVAAAGWAQVAWWPFASFTFVGKLLRYVVVAWVTSRIA
jgi:membrane protein YqaA with SNARE-associated domain